MNSGDAAASRNLEPRFLSGCFLSFWATTCCVENGIILGDNLLAMAKEKASVRANMRYSAAYLTGRSVAVCGLQGSFLQEKRHKCHLVAASGSGAILDEYATKDAA